MRFTKLAGLGAAVALNAAKTFAQSSFCAEDASDICFAWGVPERAISSGSGNVYFQITAPTSYAWAGLGIGSSMSGADMFIMYTDGSGNVTLSTRAGTGHSMPQYERMPNVQLLEGSGVQDGRMVANVRCRNCESLDLADSNSWIAAWHSGAAMDTASVEETITYHDGRTVFEVDMAQASISSNANPFLDTAPANGGGNTPDSGSGSGDSGNGAVTETETSDGQTLTSAHGIVMSIVFVVGYPLGAILIPLVPIWYVHAASQTLVFLAMWAGFGLGYVVAVDNGQWFEESHVRLGTFVVVLLVLQPILGYVHHMQYKKHQRRSAFSYAHIWYGRVLMVFGIINGGLGISLTGSSNSYMIAYAVVAAVMGVLYIAASAFGSFRRRRSRQAEQDKVASPIVMSPVRPTY